MDPGLGPLSGLVLLLTNAGVEPLRSCVKTFADAGARLVLLGTRWQDTTPPDSLILDQDPSSRHGAEAVVAEAVARFGRVDGVVHGMYSGAGAQPGPFDEVSEGAWDELFEATVGVAWHISVAASAVMAERGGGAIVYVISSAAYHGLPAGAVASVAAQMAGIGLARAVARELGPSDISVNVLMLSPSVVAGDQSVVEEQLIKREATPADVAGALVYLLGPGGRLMTGQIVNLDGGWIVH